MWNEVCVLLQFCLALSFDSGVQSQLYLPEIFHIVTMLANTGSPDVRVTVHRLLINSIHSACTSFVLGEAKLTKLRATLDALDPKGEMFTHPVSFCVTARQSRQTPTPAPRWGRRRTLATLLFETCSVAAPSVDIANAWRLAVDEPGGEHGVPKEQPRDPAAGVYSHGLPGSRGGGSDGPAVPRCLLALRNSVGRFGGDSSSEMRRGHRDVASPKMMAKLRRRRRRYGFQLFWLAHLAVLRCSS